MKFPKHKCGLYLEHNPHKDVYIELKDWLKEPCHDDEDWISPEEKQKALDNNEIWILRWYPDTPIGSYVLMGYSLDTLLKAAEDVDRVSEN